MGCTTAIRWRFRRSERCANERGERRAHRRPGDRGDRGGEPRSAPSDLQNLRQEATLLLLRRRSQVVRQRSAKPPSPVRLRSAPLPVPDHHTAPASRDDGGGSGLSARGQWTRTGAWVRRGLRHLPPRRGVAPDNSGYTGTLRLAPTSRWRPISRLRNHSPCQFRSLHACDMWSGCVRLTCEDAVTCGTSLCPPRSLP